jgi:subfamily B ATP-binding cassette protein MsbA
MRLRNELVQKVIYLDMDFMIRTRNGELISRINGDILRIRYIVSTMIPDMSRDVVTIIGLGGYAFYQNPLLAFYALIIIPLTFYPLSLLARKMKRVSRRSQEKSADIVSKLSELLNNIEIVKSNTAEKFELRKFFDESLRLFRIALKGSRISQIIGPMMEIYGSISIALVIYFGGQSVFNGDMSVGELFSFLTAVGLLFEPIKNLSKLYNKMQDGVSATERVIELMSRESSIADNGTKHLSKIESIRLQNSSLSYRDRDVLKKLNFEAHSGDKVALVGGSGGGKSSIINLILRFYDTSSGEILINGTDIREFSLNSLRKEIAFVSQRVYIFQDTLLNNIAYGDNSPDREKAFYSLKVANGESILKKLDNGIDGQLEEFGLNLSGGERQRVALARAIYRDSSLLILDEATSALDNRVEEEILQNMSSITENKIVITVAHRLSTIYDSDSILLLQNGEVIANGTHKTLLQSSDSYRELSRIQN